MEDTNRQINRAAKSFLIIGIVFKALPMILILQKVIASSKSDIVTNLSFFALTSFVGILIQAIPYLVIGLVLPRRKSASLGGIIGAGLLVYIVDVYLTVPIMFFPSSSTAGLALPFIMVLLMILMPFGFFIGKRIASALSNTRYIMSPLKFTWGVIALYSAFMVINILIPDASIRKQVDVKSRAGDPRITIGNDVLAKSLIFQDESLGFIHNIQVGDFNADNEDEVALFSSSKMILLNSTTYEVIASSNLDGDYTNYFEFIDVDRDGKYEIMQSKGRETVGLRDINGNTLWSFTPKSNYAEMVFIDLDEDGVGEFYIKDRVNMYRLDNNGRPIWETDKGFLDKKFLSDIDSIHYQGTGASRIITVKREHNKNISDFIYYIWDSNGNIINEFKAPSGREFSVVDWQGEQSLVTCCTKVISQQGKVLMDYSVDSTFTYNGPFAKSVKFMKDEFPYLAVVYYGSSGIQIGQLNIFSPDGNIVFQEILYALEGMGILTDKTDGTEKLLVSGRGGKLWAYSLQ